MPGGSEMMIVLLVILLLFGAKRLPELSRSLGKSLGEFRKGQEEGAQPDAPGNSNEKLVSISED
jgi:sec-independent protein translocase protein TatA